jgi:hypothetical protein
MNITLDQTEYEALVALAQEGVANSPNRARELNAFLTSIEKKNGIRRYFLAIRWQELNQPLPSATQFPESWPPTMSATLELITRPISRADVDQLLESRAKNPTSVMVTNDPGLRLGWTLLDDYFFETR